MGYLEHVLIHTFLCVLAVSMVLKFLNFAAINRKSGVMLIAVFMILTHVVHFFRLNVEFILVMHIQEDMNLMIAH